VNSAGLTGGGWGTHFHVVTCSGGVAFRNDHWTTSSHNAWLAPAGTTNGSGFRVDSLSEYCFRVLAPV
jgi:hypothetical protein